MCSVRSPPVTFPNLLCGMSPPHGVLFLKESQAICAPPSLSCSRGLGGGLTVWLRVIQCETRYNNVIQQSLLSA